MERGLYLAVKGGHNGESHNHNDVGNFVIAVDGEPVIIDVGVETYTRFTFGPERYHIWTMRSSYHNLPVVDGVEQAPGAEFRARDARAVVEADRLELELDIAGAYPEAAGIAAWRRRVALERKEGGSVELHETFVLRHRPASLALHMMARQAVTEVAPGVLRCASPSRPLEVTFDAEELSTRCERLAITDARLEPVWGDAVFRVVLESRRPRREGTWRLRFRIGD